MTDERPLSERPAARPIEAVAPPELTEVVPKDPAAEESRLKRLKLIWGLILIAIVIGWGVGTGLANAGTTRTWVCIGSSFGCQAIQTTPLADFGIFLQYSCPVLALVALGFFLAFLSAAKSID